MSSWSGGRVHFRERKMPSLKVTPQINISNPEIKVEQVVNEYPSKYFIPNRNPKSNDAVVCAIALNEEPYIDEWIRYNLLLGFNHIYIYDNSDNNSLKDKKSDKVTIIHFPGSLKQIPAYNTFTETYKNKHKWAAFIDCDEFIVLKKHKSIMDFLNDYDKCESVALNWKMFGTSNEKEYKDEPVTSRFRYCSNKINHYVKSISKLHKINTHLCPHHPELKTSNHFDTNRNIVNAAINNNGDDRIACIHHYWTKSEDEFRKKILRGRAIICDELSLSLLDNIHSSNNDVYNSDAWDFYSKHLEQTPS